MTDTGADDVGVSALSASINDKGVAVEVEGGAGIESVGENGKSGMTGKGGSPIAAYVGVPCVGDSCKLEVAGTSQPTTAASSPGGTPIPGGGSTGIPPGQGVLGAELAALGATGVTDAKGGSVEGLPYMAPSIENC
jgi:hypothetical protein